MDKRSAHYVEKPECVIPPKSSKTTTISCVGDSITAGGWPQIMQQNLNTKYGVGAYSVINFGECGSTMQRHADSPYDQRPSWPKVLNTSSDIVVIMLGTNDAKDLSDGGPPNWENNGVTAQVRRRQGQAGGEERPSRRDLRLLVLVGGVCRGLRVDGRPASATPSRPDIYVTKPCPNYKPGVYGMNHTVINYVFPVILSQSERRRGEEAVGTLGGPPTSRSLRSRGLQHPGQRRARHLRPYGHDST